MNVPVPSAIVFGSLLGATLLGMGLRTVLPPDHLGPAAKDSVRIAMGSVATMAALVLGLLVASMNRSYEEEKNGIGLFAPPNSTVIVALTLAAFSVSGAIFLILELDLPFDGIIQIPPAPLHNALQHLNH